MSTTFKQTVEYKHDLPMWKTLMYSWANWASAGAHVAFLVVALIAATQFNEDAADVHRLWYISTFYAVLNGLVSVTLLIVCVLLLLWARGRDKGYDYRHLREVVVAAAVQILLSGALIALQFSWLNSQARSDTFADPVIFLGSPLPPGQERRVRTYFNLLVVSIVVYTVLIYVNLRAALAWLIPVVQVTQKQSPR